MSVPVNTSCRFYVDFLCFLFFHPHREVSTFTGALPEESDQFRFLRPTCLTNLRVSVGLILDKTSTMMVTVIPLDLSERTDLNPLPRRHMMYILSFLVIIVAY